MIIGLLGRAGSGKTTVADYLVREHGAQKFSFAAPLKEMARRVYALSDAQLYGPQAVKETVDPRYGRSPRELLQYLGTDVCRDILGEDVWVNAAMRAITPFSLWVCDDVRFFNEWQAIHLRGGKVVKLTCPDATVTPGSGHASEQIDEIPFDLEVVSRRADRDLLDQARRRLKIVTEI
jgi:hypothetical protein